MPEMMPEIERIPYDEFGLFHENAEEFGLPWSGPPLVRRVAVPARGRPVAQRARVGRRPRRGRAPPRWRPERPHVGHGGHRARAAARRHRPARSRPLRRRSQRQRRPRRQRRRRRHRRSRRSRPTPPAWWACPSVGSRPSTLADRHPSLARSLVLVDITPGRRREQGRGDHRVRRTARRASPASPRSWPAPWSSTRPVRSRRCGAASCTTPSNATTAPGCGATQRHRAFEPESGARAARPVESVGCRRARPPCRSSWPAACGPAR